MTTFIIRRMNSRIIHGRIGQCLSFKNYERYFNAHIISSLAILKYFRAFYNIYQLTFPVPINASIIATKKIQQVTTIPMKMSLMSIIKMIGFVFNFQYGLEKLVFIETMDKFQMITFLKICRCFTFPRVLVLCILDTFFLPICWINNSFFVPFLIRITFQINRNRYDACNVSCLFIKQKYNN